MYSAIVISNVCYYLHAKLLGECKVPPFVENSVTNDTREEHKVGSVIQVQCIEGHRFRDGETIKTISCHGDGEWDQISNCKGNNCIHG